MNMTRPSKSQLEFVDTVSEDPKHANAGVLRIFENCFNGDDLETYRNELLKTTKGSKLANDSEGLLEYYHEWKTWQLSDHLVMWARLDINDSVAYINSCRIP